MEILTHKGFIMTHNRGVYMPLYICIDIPQLALREQIHLSGEMQS